MTRLANYESNKSSRGNYFRYPKSIRAVGTQYGKMAAFTTAEVKFMLKISDFNKYSKFNK